MKNARHHAILHYLEGQEGDTLLDIGGGTGRLTDQIARQGITCTVLDNDQQLLAIGRHDHPDITFINGDALALPFPDRSFDHAIMEELLEHIPYHCQSQLFHEAWRVLKPDGKMILTTPNRPIYRWWIAACNIKNGKIPWQKVPGHVAEIDLRRLRALVQETLPGAKTTIQGINPFLKTDRPRWGINFLLISRKKMRP